MEDVDLVLTAKHLRNAFSEAAESDIQKTLYPWQKVEHIAR